MTALLLVAASGLAREALEAARAQGRYDVVGIVDDDPARWGELIDGVKVIGGLEVVADHPDAAVLICAGNGAVREQLTTRLALPDERYATVVHPSVDVPSSCTVGVGSVLLAGTVLTASVVIGRHVVVMPNVTLTHDDEVEDFVTLCAGVVLGGSVHVAPRAYLGMAASVRERVNIAADSTLGMGAVLLVDTSPRETWVGCPARPIWPARETNVS